VTAKNRTGLLTTTEMYHLDHACETGTREDQQMSFRNERNPQETEKDGAP
jgi:hypothetical protein